MPSMTCYKPASLTAKTTRLLNNVILMLDHRRRRWANIKIALFECLVFVGFALASVVALGQLQSVERFSSSIMGDRSCVKTATSAEGVVGLHRSHQLAQ